MSSQTSKPPFWKLLRYGITGSFPSPSKRQWPRGMAQNWASIPAYRFWWETSLLVCPCTHPTHWYNHARQGSSRGQQAKGILACCARDLARTHSCDQAKSLTQTLGMLSEILSSQIVCFTCHILPKIILRAPRRETWNLMCFSQSLSSPPPSASDLSFLISLPAFLCHRLPLLSVLW